MSHKTTEEDFLQALAEGNFELAQDIIDDCIDDGEDSSFTDHLSASLKRAKKADEEIE